MARPKGLEAAGGVVAQLLRDDPHGDALLEHDRGERMA